jgi:hypothetical protein
MSKYIYVVTRIVEGKYAGNPIPNLGVHSTLKKALSHFDSVVESRVAHGYEKVYHRYFGKNIEREERYKVVWEVLVKNPCEVEELRLEKWIL